MEELKERIFQFGIYGERILALNEEEIEMIVEEPWVEITTTDIVEKLKIKFTTNSLKFSTNRSMLKNFAPDLLRVRMGTLAWKDYLTSDRTFNFTSKEYFLIMDFLVRSKGHVDNVQLRRLNLDPKKVHYCIKRLSEKGFIEYKSAGQGENFMYKVRVVTNSEGFVVKGLADEKQNIMESAERHQKHLFEYKIDVGLYDNIRDVILHSADGVTTEDLKNKLGISSKVGYKLLNKIYSEESSLITRDEEFEGRVRRYRYYYPGNKEAILAQGSSEAGSHITVRERMNAIRKVMSTSPVLQLNRQTYERLQEITGWKYKFDRRTIIRAAILAGFNVHKNEHTTSGGCRYVITEPGISKDDPRVRNVSFTEREKELSGFQRKIYSTFINSQKFVEIDNGYVSSKSERLRLFYAFITDYMSSRCLESLNFDWRTIREMNVDLLLSVVPFNRIGLRSSICAFMSSKRDKEHKDVFFRDECVLPEETDDSDLNVLKSTKIGELMDAGLPPSVQRLFRLKVGTSSFASLFKYLNETLILDVEISSERILVKKVLKDAERVLDDLRKLKNSKGHRKYVTLEKRISFFKDICKIEENEFYDKAYKVIYERFSGDEFDAMLDRLKVFKVESIVSTSHRQRTLEKLYMHFKRNIVEQGWLGALDFSMYSISEAKRAFRRLSRDRVISNYKNIRRIEFVTPHERFYRMLRRRYDMSRFQGYQKYKGEGYFSHYFDAIYYTLATSGSLKLESLISKVKLLTHFEMKSFLEEYKDVFETSDKGGTSIVSLKMLMDPFESL